MRNDIFEFIAFLNASGIIFGFKYKWRKWSTREFTRGEKMEGESNGGEAFGKI